MKWRDKSNDEQIAEARASRERVGHKPNCMCGLCVYESLFRAQRELRCLCPNPTWLGLHRANLAMIGTFCTTCGLLHYNSIWSNTYPCESCGKFFSYDYRKFLPEKPYDSSTATKLPEKVALCKDCDNDIPVSPSVNGRSGFRIN